LASRWSDWGWRALEIGLRVFLIWFVIYHLPGVFSNDVHHFYGQATHYSLFHLDHFPYRYTPHHQQTYEFPPFTLPYLDLQRIFTTRVSYVWAFALTMAVFEYASLLVLRHSWPELRRRFNVVWYASVVPMALLGWFRFDFPAIFFATIAIVAMVKGWRHGTTSGIILGFGTKLWPGVLIPCLAIRRRWKEVAMSSFGCALLLLCWYQFSPRGFKHFLSFRAGSGLEIESLPASVLLLRHRGRFLVRSGAWVINPAHSSTVSTLLTLMLAVFVVFVLTWAWRHPEADIVALAGALTLASFLLSRIISAQYVLWTAPFVAILYAKGNRRVGWLNTGSALLTLAYLWHFKDRLLHNDRLLAWILLARNVFLVFLLVELTRAIRPIRQGEVAAATDPSTASTNADESSSLTRSIRIPRRTGVAFS
jgi:hypothetical protein